MTRRLVVAFLLLTTLVLALLEIPLGISVSRQQEDELIADIQRDAFFLASFVEDSLEKGEVADVDGIVDEYQARTGARVVVTDADARLVADSDPLPGTAPDRTFDREEILTALDGGVATGARGSTTLGTDLVYAAVPVASGGVVHGAVRVSYPREEVDERIQGYWMALVGIAAISLLAATALAVTIGRSVVKPLRELEQAAAALGGGDLSVRAPADSGPRDVRTLAVAFNEMASRLEELIGAQEAFVADASHQLRTPLTALRLRIENAIEESSADVADLEAALGETTRLSRLVDGLLALARADRASGASTADDVAVGPLLEERAEVWQIVGDEQGVAVTAEPSDLRVRANPDRAIQVLDNLVANALDALTGADASEGRAGDATGRGRVALRSEVVGPRVVIHVVDDGPGLTDEQRDRAFDRFWRAGGDSGVDQLGGTGLGLAICRKLVAADGGSIELGGAEGGGLDVRVTYRLVDDTSASVSPRPA